MRVEYDPVIAERATRERDSVRKYSLCFLCNGCDFANEPGGGHKCLENDLSETAQKVICATTSLTALSCLVAPMLTIANCYMPQILALSATHLLTACIESTAISCCEATTAVFCAGTSIYCSCYHCKDQNV